VAPLPSLQPQALTPLQQQALALYMSGTTSPTELGRALGVTRQRGQELIAALRTKVLTSRPSPYASVHQRYPITDRDNPFPRKARRARQGPFIIRANDQLPDIATEDGDAGIEETSVVWTCQQIPRELGWSWTVERSRPWTPLRTRKTYADWRTWLELRQHGARAPRWQLPELDADDSTSVAELTRTIGWAIGIEALVSENLLQLPA